MTSATHRNGRKHPPGAGLLLSSLLVLAWALPAPASGAGPQSAARPSFLHPRAASEPGRVARGALAPAADRASIPRTGRAREDEGASLRLSEVRVEDPGTSLRLREVRVSEVPVAVAESEHFVLEWAALPADGGEGAAGGLLAVSAVSPVAGDEAGPGVPVVLAVFDLRGRRVRTLVEADLEPGRYTVA